jgi:hypothetical protein
MVEQGQRAYAILMSLRPQLLKTDGRRRKGKNERQQMSFSTSILSTRRSPEAVMTFEMEKYTDSFLEALLLRKKAKGC